MKKFLKTLKKIDITTVYRVILKQESVILDTDMYDVGKLKVGRSKSKL